MGDLLVEACEACKTRGHWMYRPVYHNEGNAVSQCADCGMELQVLLNPKLNETNIAGEAVALNCTA